jgi:hypothetical protein
MLYLSMAKKKRPTDINLLARQIVEEAIGEPLTENPVQEPTIAHQPVKEKNPAAVALGRLGGLKGGKARAVKLSSEERKEIATKAAEKRWGKKPA